MLFKVNKKASVILYIIILVNITLIMGISIYNYIITINNNSNFRNNENIIFKNIYKKGNLAIKSVKKFNTNGDGFTDFISCPTNVTMSGSENKDTGILTEMFYNFGNIYCKGTYRGEDFRIYFNTDKTNYYKAYYKGDLVKLEYKTDSGDTTLGTTNIAEGLDVSSSINDTFNSNDKGNTNDGDTETEYVSYRESDKKASLIWTLDSDKYIGKIKIIKRYRNSYSWFSNNYWDEGYLKFYDSSGNEVIESKEIVGALDGSSSVADVVINELTGVKTVEIEVDLGDAGKVNKLHKIELITKNDNKYLDLFEFEMYEYEDNDENSYWVGEREFNDSDNTLISFDHQGTGGGDNIDDNMNSDNYLGSSTGAINYAFGYEDDDIIPRKTFWGNVPVGYQFYNIFWNNYKTNEFIDSNPYNNFGYSKKISEVGTGFVYLDTYNTENTGESIFDLKIIQFDRQKYRQLNTLLPVKSWEGKNIDNFVGYIQLSDTGSLSLSNGKTGKEFPFNFKDNDYAIFLTNKNNSGDISYILKAETETGTGIYINPINDSLTGTIEVMSNHMLMGGDKNFIGENFVVVGPK